MRQISDFFFLASARLAPVESRFRCGTAKCKKVGKKDFRANTINISGANGTQTGGEAASTCLRMTDTQSVAANAFQTVSSIHQANGAHMDEISQGCSANFGCVCSSAEHIRVPSTPSEQKLLEWRGL